MTSISSWLASTGSAIGTPSFSHKISAYLPVMWTSTTNLSGGRRWITSGEIFSRLTVLIGNEPKSVNMSVNMLTQRSYYQYHVENAIVQVFLKNCCGTEVCLLPKMVVVYVHMYMWTTVYWSLIGLTRYTITHGIQWWRLCRESILFLSYFTYVECPNCNLQTLW